MPTIYRHYKHDVFFFYKSHHQEIEKTKIKALKETENGHWGSTETHCQQLLGKRISETEWATELNITEKSKKIFGLKKVV